MDNKITVILSTKLGKFLHLLNLENSTCQRQESEMQRLVVGVETVWGVHETSI